jgi:RNA polymerase sigma-70 factor (ECF subfamily)
MVATVETDVGQVLEQARAGNRHALGELLELYRNYLGLLARVQIGRRLQRKVDAGDLVQETFLAAHRDWERFEGVSERELVAWLREILAAKLAKLVRCYFGTQRRNVLLERDLAEELAQSSRALDCGLFHKDDSPSVQVAHREQGVLLANALSELPEDYREVLILRHLEGLSFPQVSERMGRTLDAVKKLWLRALDRLRRSLRGAS